MVSPPQHNSTTSELVQDAQIPQQVTLYASRPHLKRALSSPVPKHQVEPGKRHFSSYSQGVVIILISVLRFCLMRLFFVAASTAHYLRDCVVIPIMEFYPRF